MTQLYLITGFLGAGKTTFLQNFIRLFPGKRVRLIINEFGQVGVDGALLRELDGDLSEISGGSVFCSCRLDQFEKALERALADKPDVVLVEASGLSDPTNVRHILKSYPTVDYRGSICLADAQRLPKVFSTARMCPRQISVSGLVLLNKTDLATPEECAAAEDLIMSAHPGAHIRRTVFGQMDPAWLALLTPQSGDLEGTNRPDLTLQRMALLVSQAMPEAALKKCLAALTEETYRVKGLVRLAEGTFLVDCTGPVVKLVPWQGGTDNVLVLLAGRGMALRKAAKIAIQWYADYLMEVKP